jgi:hypothetical protein
VAINTVTNVLTVTINQTILSQLAVIGPNVLALFQLAFQESSLDLPVQYTYVVNVTS